MNTVALSANTSWYLYNFRASTIRALVDKGHPVICLAPEDDYSERLNSMPGCEWFPLPMDNQGSNPVRDVLLFLRFVRYYRQLTPAVTCHFTIKNNIYGTWAAWLLGIPAINNISGLGTSFTRGGLVPWMARQLYRSSQGFATKIFCQNPHDYDELRSWHLVPRNRLELLPGSGVDGARFCPTPTDLPTANREFRFLFAGRMLADKGLNELIGAMDILNREQVTCTLWLCGFTDTQNASTLSEKDILNWTQERAIQWLGPTDEIEAIYREVDCVVLPSYREGLPRSLLEACAMGLPVITTNTPGCSDVVIDGENGLLCEPRNTESLAAAMSRMMELSARERQAMGRRGRERALEKYDERKVIAATLSAIEAALEDKKRPGCSPRKNRSSER